MELEYGIRGFTLKWSEFRRQFVRITYDSRLQAPTESATLRYVLAHEMSHIICQHKGNTWIFWAEESPAWAFYHVFHQGIERQSDSLAAYLLMSIEDMLEMRHQEPWYIARQLDVPEKLVPLRWEIYQKYKR